MKSQLTKQFPRESSPRNLYIATRSGGTDKLETYAFSARYAFEQFGFQRHEITDQTEEVVQSKWNGQTFEVRKAV